MTEQREIRLESSWKTRLTPEFSQPYMTSLREFLLQRKKAGAVIYPPGGKIFKALDSTPFDAVKVVILGQDPYHGPGQAHGLCFSVRLGVPTPPSLINILKEIEDDLGIAAPDHGYLQHWANQGVLLLNAVLTVERGRAGAHQGKGWEPFTDQVVRLQLRPEKGRSHRPRPPPGIDRAASVTAVGAPGFLRLPAFFPGQPLPGATGRRAHRLVAAAGGRGGAHLAAAGCVIEWLVMCGQDQGLAAACAGGFGSAFHSGLKIARASSSGIQSTCVA
jgi:uracil-DNA glycosylase